MLPKEGTNRAYVPAANPQPSEKEPHQPERELPDKLVRAMRRAEPRSKWPELECKLKKAYNARLARSQASADAWVERETKDYEEHVRARWLMVIAKVATAILTAATTIARIIYWRL